MQKTTIILSLICIPLFHTSSSPNSTPRLSIVIRNSHDTVSRRRAENLQRGLLKQADEMGLVSFNNKNILMLHEAWAPLNAWTILPVFEYLYEKYLEKGVRWVFFCEDNTEINLKGLVRVLQRFKSEERLFIGHALYDEEASIIHHFKFQKGLGQFKYPDFDAGWAVTMELIKHSVDRLRSNPPTSSFSIDIQYEVAMFFYYNDILLTDIRSFCVNKPLSEECVSTVQYSEPDCGTVAADDILVSVKTCEKFHETRIPVFKVTSALNTKHIKYYSEVADESIPTENIGVPNTNSGHCAKLLEIIMKFRTMEEWRNKKWLVIVDDDTIMNFSRLQRQLACYNPDENVVLGERYGYGVNFKTRGGYSYPTGGSGMILSQRAAISLLKGECECWAPDAPDDMWLGLCLSRLGIPMVPSKSLHQTYPTQYSREFLSHRYLVSFHKHNQQDPVEIYRDYLGGRSEGSNKNHGNGDRVMKNEL